MTSLKKSRSKKCSAVQCCSETYHRQKTYHRQTNIFKFTRYFYKLAQINLSSARTFPEDFNTHDTFHHCLSTIDILVNSGKIQIRNTVHSTTWNNSSLFLKFWNMVLQSNLITYDYYIRTLAYSNELWILIETNMYGKNTFCLKCHGSLKIQQNTETPLFFRQVRSW